MTVKVLTFVIVESKSKLFAMSLIRLCSGQLRMCHEYVGVRFDTRHDYYDSELKNHLIEP